ncbi:olfactory receptor 14J1-like [Nannospalax galili]|uniref:olfactory receptor 14J1-like n=1 Tax=Nannospalax galili TaxID=1026970 RepID=UPI000819B265|nr:olfactory receptor 14J1-like [Nannospalax galili]
MILINITTVRGFLLLGFSDNQELQILHGFLFLVMYLLGLAGNFIIITITMMKLQFQSPMYYFLRHLALLDISLLSVTVPQSIHNSLTGSGCISYAQCVLQVFFFTSLDSAELAILTVMSYDHYVAICLPLHYEIIMRTSRWAVTALWISGGISGTLYTATTFSMRFCRDKIIQQFFCDVPQLLKLSCSSDYLGVIGVVALMSSLGFACFIAIALSYVQIFSTVLRVPSAEGRSKVFSTCLPHLCVVSFFTSTGACAYLKPTSDSPTTLDLIISIFYTVLPPTLNPVIYSLRNETMKGAVKLILGSCTISNHKSMIRNVTTMSSFLLLGFSDKQELQILHTLLFLVMCLLCLAVFHSLLKLSCSNDYLGVIGVVSYIAVLVPACFITIALSYVQIFSTVLRMPSATGTCAYLKATLDSTNVLDLTISVLYSTTPNTQPCYLQSEE